MRIGITKALNLIVVVGAGLVPRASHGGFSLPSGSASPGNGISNVLSGSVANGALYWETTTNWLASTPAKPYALTNSFTLPACDSIRVARIVTTVWGGTANYTSQMTVSVNGANLALANPLTFGTTGDTNAEFSATAANAYGSGSGLWLVSLPVPAEMLYTDGTPNTVVMTQTTPDSFDGRIHHVTLLAVYQSAGLANRFDYAIAEGSGDIFKSPAGTQLSQRTVAFAGVSTNSATAAKLTALYTYGDTSQNDRLYFNGVQYGSDDVAQWDKSIANFGPSAVGFDVLSNLAVSNTVTFSVGADVPPTQETSLRPQLAALAVTRAALSAGTVGLTRVDVSGAHLTWNGPASGSFAIEGCTNLASGKWDVLTNFVSAGGTLSFTDGGATNLGSRFYRATTQ
jgi:hypothetical protein